MYYLLANPNRNNLCQNILHELNNRSSAVAHKDAHRIDVNTPYGPRQTGNACRKGGHRRPSQVLLLAMVNRLKRASISYPPPGLDFNHMDVAVLLGDDIQLSVACLLYTS